MQTRQIILPLIVTAAVVSVVFLTTQDRSGELSPKVKQVLSIDSDNSTASVSANSTDKKQSSEYSEVEKLVEEAQAELDKPILNDEALADIAQLRQQLAELNTDTNLTDQNNGLSVEERIQKLRTELNQLDNDSAN